MKPSTRDAIRAGYRTAIIVFVGLFGASLAGWLTDLLRALQSTDAVVVYPDPKVLLKALVTAVVAAALGLLNMVVNLVQSTLGVGKPPQYPPH